MQGQSVQIIGFRGDDWLLFSLVNAFSQPPKKNGSPLSFKGEKHCDLVLAAVIPSSPFWIQFSQTTQARPLPQHPRNHSQQSPLLVQIAVRSTITFLERLYPWGNSALPNDPPELLPVEQVQKFMGKVSLRSPDTQELIMVHTDRACLVFHEWEERIKHKSAWQTPMAFLATLAITLATATFKDFSWISAGTIRGVFLAAAIGSLGWFVWEIRKAWKCRSASPENFIADLTKGTKQTDYGIPSKTNDNS